LKRRATRGGAGATQAVDSPSAPVAPRLAHSDVRLRLIAASCALLGAGGARAQSGDAVAPLTPSIATPAPSDEWQIDSALAYYHEDGRIRAIEPVVDVAKNLANGQVIGVNLTFDSLSGSSPNGALPSRKAQTFASPSGTSLTDPKKTYTTAPGQLPVDPNYSDDRLAAGASWQIPITRVTQTTLGGKLSYEHDFFSVSGNAAIAQDFNDKNTTLNFGLNEEYDSIRPIGGTPIAGSDYSLFEKNGGDKTKNGISGLLGVTQVMTRNWLSIFNLAADRFTGYLNDPYKILSIVDGAGDTSGYQYESRPDHRTRKSAYLENRVGWDRASTALSLRYMSDDWHIHSETAQLQGRLWFSDQDKYVEPTLRWYKQTAAYFYTPFIPAGEQGSTGYASSDSRLGEFHALTVGLKYGEKLAGQHPGINGEFSARIEYYQQISDGHLDAPGSLQGLDLVPKLKAVLVQIGWRF